MRQSSYVRLPSFSEMPEVFNVTLLPNATEEGMVYGSKAVGGPPLMLAFSMRGALRQAAAAFGPPGVSVDLASPATPEVVYWAQALLDITVELRRGHFT
jgi:xanthine dehydrogenase large subunit